MNKKISNPITKLIRYLKKRDTIAIVRLDGVIGKVHSFSPGLNIKAIDYVEGAFKASKIKAVALVINSPGGSPVQSELIYKKIRALATEKKKKPMPVFAFCEDVAASGGYFLACSADEIYASNSSIVGSIGVISASFGFNDAIKKIGVERRIITQGKNKSTLDPFMPSKKEDVDLIKNIQKDIHESFIDIVKSSRGKKLKGKEEDIFSGKFWSGKQAKKIGLIDDIGDVETVMKEKFGKKIKFKTYSARSGFLRRKFGISENKFAIMSEVIYTKLQEFSLWERYKNF